MTKKALIRLFALAVLIFMLAACSDEPEEAGTDTSDTGTEENGETETETAEGSEGGDLVIAALSDATILDPHISSDVPSGNVQINIYETLTKFDENLELQPLLAESWEAIDETVWEFKLREGVTFTDGAEFNAEAVKTNLDRLLDEDLASPRAILFNDIDEVVVVDEFTVQMVTEYPFAPLPSHFAHYASSMISPEVIQADYDEVEAGGDFGTYVNENPVGTGTFTYNNWEPGVEIVLERNDDYWGEPAKVDSVTFRVVAEDLTRIADLETGGAHIIDPVMAPHVEQLENTEGVHPYITEGATITYMGFNVEKEPFDDPRVRRAIAMALNKQEMVDGILEGTGEVAVGPINSTQFGFSDEVDAIEYDIEAAKELLAEAGYEDGFETTIWTNDSQERIDIATYTQEGLTEIGVDVEIEVVEWGAYLDATANGEHEIFILGLSLGTMDADYPMHMMFHSENVGATGNRTFMQSEEFDQMLYEARIEQDEDTRLQMYIEATNWLNEESPMAFLYHPAQIMGYAEGVNGFWADGSGLYQLRDVTID
ncbi:glutathione ABC transporter substrate-binding protein [Virgibacillus sp. YIM 98842]|uniref:glutathione ABC transporter substrate-binding protein n=1 Tax=Virgibacillus sp. YIM 98842 TaxID=2663533 RepID=UPI003204902E